MCCKGEGRGVCCMGEGGESCVVLTGREGGTTHLAPLSSVVAV